MSLGTRTDPARQAQIAAAVADYARGEKVSVIRIAYGMSTDVLLEAADAAGVPRRGQGGPKISDDDRLREMVAGGMTDHEIAAEMGCGRATVSRARSRLGLECNAKPRPRRA